MRELEFLPDWYPRLRRRRRIVAIQAWILTGAVLVLGGWMGLSQRTARASESTLSSLQRQLDLTHAEQTILAQQLELRKQLQDREQLIASLGIPMEMTRLLQTIDSAMPKEMSLTEFDCSIEETARKATSVAGARGSGKADPLMDRKLNVKLTGVTPSDVDLGNFLNELTRIPFFDQVAVSYARNKYEAGHVMRAFEITFSINLNRPAGG